MIDPHEMSPRQLPLSIRWNDAASLENFEVMPVNEPAVAAVRALSGSREFCTYLFGPDGSGKSHLAQAACRDAAHAGQTSFYLPLLEAEQFGPEALQGLESLDLVVVDDMDAVAGQAAWEEALFHLYNRMSDAGGRLLVTASHRPDRAGLALPDLTSRLAWGLVLRLEPMDDDYRLRALRRRAAFRGLELGDEVGRYLLARCPRETAYLFELLDHLDREALAAQRRLTIPFVKAVTGL